jgi:hypothetical protein
MALTETRNIQRERLRIQEFGVFQKSNTNWAAVRSDATEMASLNQ